MNSYRDNGYNPNGDLSRTLAQAMLRAVERNYGRLISAARKEWERKFAASDRSDACVTVRISAGESQDLSRMFPLESRRALESFVPH